MELQNLDYSNLKEVCRLCLKTPGRKIGIFEEEGQHRQIGYKIRSCLPDLIYPGDPLPQSVCPGCLVKLENNFEFLQKYLKNSRILRNVLLKETQKDVPETQKYIQLLENGVHTQMHLRKPIARKSSYACCQDDDSRTTSVEEQDENFDWQPAEALIDLEPQEEIFQIFVQDGPSNTFLPEPDDLTLMNATEASYDTPVGSRTKDDDIQQNAESVTSVENAPENASQPVECNSSANASEPTAEYSEISITIKQEPEEVEEQEIEVTWLMQSAEQEEDALDISKVKTEPVPLSLSVIKQEQTEAAAVSVINNNTANIKEETSISSAQPRTRSRRINVECSKCFLVFHREIQILRHRCIGVSPWYCKPCNKYYKTKETFSRHKRYSCYSKEATCVVCDNVYPNGIQLAKHQVNHMRLNIKQLDVSKLNTCKTCSRTFISKASLNMHERSHLNMNERGQYLSGEEPRFLHALAIPQSTGTHSELAHSSNRNVADQQYAKMSGKLKNQYHCTVCKAVFTNQKLFIAHNRQHSLKNKYKPKKQTQPFIPERNKGQQEKLKHTSVKLDVAVKKYSSVNGYTCIVCRKSFDTQEILIEHKKLHTPAKTALTHPFSSVKMGNGTVPLSEWICKICGLDCKQSTVLWSHIHEKHSRVSYKCSHCPKTFDKLCSLKNHEKTHEPKLKCTACGKQYSTLKALAAHEQSKHFSPSATHLCRKCNIKFDSRSALLIHARNHQSLPQLKKNFASMSSKSQSSHTCSICARTFTRYDSLKRHESIHATGKHTFYPCHFCGLKLVSVPSYKAHTERHFQKMEKTQCSTCKRTYFSQDFSKHFCVKRQLSLTTSQQSTVKKFKCELCSAVFGTQQARNSHMRIHRKNWKYSTQKMEKNTPTFKKPVQSSGNMLHTIYCPLCSKAFLSKGELQHHIKLHHSKK